MKWFLICVRDKYATFSGRARRKEYWMFVLVFYILLFLISSIPGIIGAILGSEGLLLLGSIMEVLLSLAFLIPGLAVSIRRLHDVGKSGWWILINLIPLLGNLYFLYLMVKDSQPDANQWGENPKVATTS